MHGIMHTWGRALVSNGKEKVVRLPLRLRACLVDRKNAHGADGPSDRMRWATPPSNRIFQLGPLIAHHTGHHPVSAAARLQGMMLVGDHN
jgi:hypothetical protein